MPLVTYIDHAGTAVAVQLETGCSVMQGAMDNLIEGIVAECGGCCSCATCHCYVDEAWLDCLEEPSDVEKDMLECAVDPKPNSRLACQITVTDALDGLVVHLPESQF